MSNYKLGDEIAEEVKAFFHIAGIEITLCTSRLCYMLHMRRDGFAADLLYDEPPSTIEEARWAASHLQQQIDSARMRGKLDAVERGSACIYVDSKHSSSPTERYGHGSVDSSEQRYILGHIPDRR